MPEKPLIWLGSSRRDLRAFPALARGWLVSNYGESSRDSIVTTGSQCGWSDRESVRFAFTSPVHTECSTWPREPRRSTSFTHSRRRRKRRARKIYESAATGSVL